jgi:hypothetical protein
MVDTILNRRAVLLATASAVAMLAGSVRRAQALSLERVSPTSREGLALANRCGGPQEHAALVSELQAELVSETRSDGTGPASLTAACPICGCSVTVTRDGEVFGAKAAAPR